MMSKLIVAAVLAAFAAAAVAEGQGSIADVTVPPAPQQNTAQAPADVPQTPADVDMANVRSEAQAASGVPAAPAQPAAAQPAGETPPGGQQAGQATESKSSIPLDKRRGGDITECLQAGDKSDKAIAACAEKYRPRAR